jgi:hypothetical protein
MKQLLLLLAFCCFTIRALAQEEAAPIQSSAATSNDSTNSIDVRKAARLVVQVGIAIPAGSTSASGAPKQLYSCRTGGILSISYVQSLYKHMAIGLSIGVQANPVDEESYLQAEPLVEKIKSNPWVLNFFLTDLYLQVPIKQVTFYTKFSYGLGHTMRPQQEHLLRDYGSNPVKIVHQKAFSVDFAYGFASGVRFEQGKWGIGIEAGYLATTPKFHLGERLFFPNGRTELYDYRANLTLSSVNCNMQLSYKL